MRIASAACRAGEPSKDERTWTARHTPSGIQEGPGVSIHVAVKIKVPGHLKENGGAFRWFHRLSGVRRTRPLGRINVRESRKHPVLCGSLNVCCSHVVPCGLPPDGRLRSPCCSQTPAEHHAAACVGGRPPAKGVCRLALLLQHNPQAVVDVHDGGDDHGDRDGCARACWRRAAPVAAPPLARAGRAAALFSACLSLTHRCRPTSAQALATTMR